MTFFSVAFIIVTRGNKKSVSITLIVLHSCWSTMLLKPVENYFNIFRGRMKFRANIVAEQIKDYYSNLNHLQ